MNFKFSDHIILFFSTLVLLIIASFAHLMYGNCQTSKLHYMVQCYYVPSKFPKWMWVNNFDHVDGRMYAQLNSYKNYTGKWLMFDNEGNLNSEEFYLKGKLNGCRTVWDEKGNIMYIADYKNGVRNGELIEYESGVKIMEASYVNGQRRYSANWNMNGIKINEEKLDKDCTGNQFYWFDNGNIKWEIGYLKGSQHGKEIIYFENGNKEKEFNYIIGKKNGVATEWDEKGNIISIKEYKEGKEINSEN
jgi:antitoxin component YwqK of YwqJK toxin-antitoxin module